MGKGLKRGEGKKNKAGGEPYAHAQGRAQGGHVVTVSGGEAVGPYSLKHKPGAPYELLAYGVRDEPHILHQKFPDPAGHLPRLA